MDALVTAPLGYGNSHIAKKKERPEAPRNYQEELFADYIL